MQRLPVVIPSVEAPSDTAREEILKLAKFQSSTLILISAVIPAFILTSALGFGYNFMAKWTRSPQPRVKRLRLFGGIIGLSLFSTIPLWRPLKPKVCNWIEHWCYNQEKISQKKNNLNLSLNNEKIISAKIQSSSAREVELKNSLQKDQEEHFQKLEFQFGQKFQQHVTQQQQQFESQLQQHQQSLVQQLHQQMEEERKKAKKGFLF